MKDEIKEKLLREIEDNLISENRTYDERDIKKAIEEISKAKNEEFIKILEELQGLILKDGVYEIETEKHLAGLVDVKKVFNRFVEIKQKIKENEE